jgi:hypothetical protein
MEPQLRSSAFDDSGSLGTPSFALAGAGAGAAVLAVLDRAGAASEAVGVCKENTTWLLNFVAVPDLTRKHRDCLS